VEVHASEWLGGCGRHLLPRRVILLFAKHVLDGRFQLLVQCTTTHFRLAFRADRRHHLMRSKFNAALGVSK
jgi:hypothetical protein